MSKTQIAWSLFRHERYDHDDRPPSISASFRITRFMPDDCGGCRQVSEYARDFPDTPQGHRDAIAWVEMLEASENIAQSQGDIPGGA